MKRTRRSSISDNEDEKDIKKRRRWNEQSEEYLIQLWYHNIDILRKTRRTAGVFKEFAKEMANEGYHFTAIEIQNKIHNLTNKYKLEKRQLSIKGGKSTWKFYEIVHKIYTAYKKPLDEEALDINEDVEEEEDAEQYNNEDSMISLEEMEISQREKKIDVKTIKKDESIYSGNEEITNNLKPLEKTDHSDQKQPKTKRENLNNRELIEMLKNCQQIMQLEAEERQKSDAKMLQIQKELVAIERERNELLRELLT
ncbi:uncharacterized protein [Musca autumnalis]|uniref:uncharacterized protein n=1 Tax=Musca autumnalis TaxID=221902 RepID=UPI003CF670C1